MHEIVVYNPRCLFAEVSVEAQWIQTFRGSKFPSWDDQQQGIYSSLGEIELPSSLMSAANYSDLPGNMSCILLLKKLLLIIRFYLQGITYMYI